MAKLRIENLIGGWASDYQPDNTFAVEARSNQYTNSTGIDLFGFGYNGYIKPANALTTIADSGSEITSLIRSSTTDVQTTEPPKTYMITGGLSGTAPKIILENSSAVQAGDAIGLPGAHSGHNFTTMQSGKYWGEDTALYKHNLGGTSTLSLFYSWQDNTDGDIGKGVLSAISDTNVTMDDDWISTTATGGSTTGIVTGVPHKFAEGSDLILYFTNGQYIGSYDGNIGNNGTVNYQALNIGAGWTANSIRRYKNYIAVSCVKSIISNAFTFESENKVVLWDGFSPDPNFVYEITDSRLSSIFVANGVLFAFTDGKNNTTKLWQFNGSAFVLLDEQLTARIGGTPEHQCIDYYKDCITWASGSNIVAYGKLSSSVKGIHLVGKNSDGTNTSSSTGFIRNSEQSLLRVSGLYDTTYSLKYQDTSKYLTGVKLRTRMFKLPHRSIIKKFTINFAQFGTGASVTLSLFKNKTTESVGGAADLLNKQLTATVLGSGTESFSWETNIDDVDSFYMTITFDHASISNTAAIIESIELDIEPTNAY